MRQNLNFRLALDNYLGKTIPIKTKISFFTKLKKFFLS